MNLKHNELDFPTELYTLASLSKYFMVLAVYKFLCMWLAFEHLVLTSFMIMARIAPTWRTRLLFSSPVESRYCSLRSVHLKSSSRYAHCCLAAAFPPTAIKASIDERDMKNSHDDFRFCVFVIAFSSKADSKRCNLATTIDFEHLAIGSKAKIRLSEPRLARCCK